LVAARVTFTGLLPASTSLMLMRFPVAVENTKLTSSSTDCAPGILFTGASFTFYRLPLQHHKHMKSTNMLERLNEEIKRRTRVVRIFPNGASCLRLIRALAVETHEGWMEASRYINMDLLKEHQKLRLSLAA